MAWLIGVFGITVGIGLSLIAIGLGAMPGRSTHGRRRRTAGSAQAGVSPVPVAAEESEPPTTPTLALAPAPAGPAVPVATSDETSSVLVDGPRGGRRVWVRLLGPPRVEVDGREVRVGMHGRPLELLCYLVLYPDGVSPVRAAGVLWPDVQPGREVEYFANALRRLRKTIREATGDRNLRVVEHLSGHYRLDRSVVDADVWQLEAALARARQHTDTAEARQVLDGATAAFPGTLSGGVFDWIAGREQDLRAWVIEALEWLADLCEQADDQPGACVALERALGLEPTAEVRARRLMELLARLGRVDGVRRCYRRLEAALAEQGEQPSPETTRLRKLLLGQR